MAFLSSPKIGIKICGMTRVADIEAAVEAGADALGFVFYPPSPRYLSIKQIKNLVEQVPACVTRVALFVNADEKSIQDTLQAASFDLLQFHGEESAAECAKWQLPWVKAARVRPALDLIQYASVYNNAEALLLDAYVKGYGGQGKLFDWGLIPAQMLESEFHPPVILSGGLNPDNVQEAICQLRPLAVDVSSGVEQSPGIKDKYKMQDFIAAVRSADAGR